MSFKWMRVYKVLPILIVYTDRMADDVGGFFFGFLLIWWICIKPKYRNDQGLHVHELIHAKQHVRWIGLMLIFYWLFRVVRLKSEVEAYRKQLRYPPATNHSTRYLAMYARFLAKPRYRLGITEKHAATLLEQGL